MLYVHVLLIAPLGARHMPQGGADQHECRVPVRKAAYHAGSPADFPVEPFNHVISADAAILLFKGFGDFDVSIPMSPKFDGIGSEA